MGLAYPTPHASPLDRLTPIPPPPIPQTQHTRRPDALPLLRRALHRAAFVLLGPPVLGLCMRAHAATEGRLLGRAAALKGKRGLAAG